MKFNDTQLPPARLITFEPFHDERGVFTRTFCQDTLVEADIEFEITQVNLSFTKQQGTVRGLHFQLPPHEEGKILHCLQGQIFDVIVDYRRDSPTRGVWQSFELNADDNTALYVPKGFAHGFQTLSDDVLVEYFMSEKYDAESSTGIRYNDPELAIPWPMAVSSISQKDQLLPFWKDLPV